MSRKVKSVSFNLDDKFEYEMYEYSKQFKGFSSFVKRLIQDSMGGFTTDIQPKVNTIQSNVTQSNVNRDFMKQLI